MLDLNSNLGNVAMSKRIKFFLGHLIFSLLIALIVSFIVTFFWYPEPLAEAVGVRHIFSILIAVDMVVGPLLGLLIYKETKKTLKFDLAVIILVQLLAMGYGIYSIAQGRPAWLVYNVDRFELVRNNEIIREDIQQAEYRYKYPSWLKPQYVATQFAKDKQVRSDEMFQEVFNGISIAQRPKRYVPLSQVKKQIQQHAQPLNKLNQYNSKIKVRKLLKEYPEATAWVPLKAKTLDMVVLINKENAVPVKVVNLRPWS